MAARKQCWQDRNSEIFKNKGLPDEVSDFFFPRPSSDIVSLLFESGLVASKGEARRMIQQGGVKIEKEKITDVNQQVDLKTPVLVQCGKRKFMRIQHRA